LKNVSDNLEFIIKEIESIYREINKENKAQQSKKIQFPEWMIQSV
jgi:hypothetical protein